MMLAAPHRQQQIWDGEIFILFDSAAAEKNPEKSCREQRALVAPLDVRTPRERVQREPLHLRFVVSTL